MVISTDALIDNVAWVIEHELGPAVADDPWLASYVRSISRILPFLRERIAMESRILDDDNRDLRVLLDDVAAAGVLRHQISSALGDAEPARFVSVEELRADNVRYRAVLDDALPQLHEPMHTAVLERVRGYLTKSVEREGPMYTPLFAGPPF